jgi:glycosyltransferase involved in cell wall biosynthesis
MNTTLQNRVERPAGQPESVCISPGSGSLGTVDVVIPCYNYAEYLRDSVHSVLSQPNVSVRVLIIDDASTDATAQVGEELAKSDPRVEFRRHSVNKGNVATFNEGLLEWSTSDYVVLLSSDDILTPGALSRAVRIMAANPKIGMVYGRPIHFTDGTDLPRISPSEAPYSRFSGSRWLEGRCRAGHNVITSPEVVVRGSIQRAVGGYRPELPHAGDLEMWLRIAAVSDIAYVKHPQAFYRVHSHNMTKSRNHVVDISQRRAAFATFFQYHQEREGVERLRDLAYRALARDALWQACRAYDRNEVTESRAAELIELAMATYPRATALPEYRALRRRRLLGPAVCNRTQLFAAPALIRRAQRWWKKERWKRQGI